ncbi:STAS/SEC14 domain-containing protein [Hymenobacter perfusus]|uniref:STAS/SEC14 domain-containing protein n=1 Tax=Hymenobacter perfusus TaxID=1236770 RepID=A0A428JZG5_9BACT|nr:STAS/SEC14 domain-containing protein [Hymenobacter perfusus]RSK39570.1 hypothetical protein EI293_20340 [Hymenobacter perfusus]
MRIPLPTLYFENKAGRLLEDPAGFLRAHWSAQERDELTFRALFNHMVQALRRHGWHRILIDQRQMRAFSTAEQQWIVQQWLPRAATEGGYRFGAIVVSEDVFTRLATAYVTTSVQGLPLVYRTFTEEAAAVAWLWQQ